MFLQGINEGEKIEEFDEISNKSLSYCEIEDILQKLLKKILIKGLHKKVDGVNQFLENMLIYFQKLLKIIKKAVKY